MFRWFRSRKKQREGGGKKRKGRKSGYDFEDKCHIYEEIPEVLPFRVHGSPPGMLGHDSVSEGAYLVVPILSQGDKAQSLENIHDLPRERVLPRCQSLDILNDIGTRRRLSNVNNLFGDIDPTLTSQRHSSGIGAEYGSNVSISDGFRSPPRGGHTGSSDTFFEYDFTSSGLSDSSASSESETLRPLPEGVRLTAYRSRSHSNTRRDTHAPGLRALSGRAMSTDSMSMTTVSSLSRCSSFLSEQKEKEFFDFSSYEADCSDGSSGYYDEPDPVIPIRSIDSRKESRRQDCCSHCKDGQLARRNRQEEIYVNNKPIKPPRRNIKNPLVSTSSTPDLNITTAPFSHSKRILKQTVLTLSQTDIRSYNNKTNNRLLGDLMRKNYDKQLLYGL